ncbi:MAG: response regulator transcription factor [Natronospirillum sp.]
MKNTIFVAPESLRLNRWQEAFPGLVWVDRINLERAEKALTWLHTGTTGWQQMLADLGKHRTVIVISLTPDIAEAMVALRGGARGYGHAWSSAELLQKMAMVVSNGGIWIGPELLELFSQMAAAAPRSGVETESPLLAQLTDREGEVARCVQAGLSNKEVARKLDITERTVKAHMGEIFQKLSVRDRVHLVLKLNQR